MFCLVNKCKALKAKAKLWKQTQFGNMFRHMRVVEAQLLTLQQKILLDANLPTLQIKQNLLLKKQMKLFTYSEEYWELTIK